MEVDQGKLKKQTGEIEKYGIGKQLHV